LFNTCSSHTTELYRLFNNAVSTTQAMWYQMWGWFVSD